MPATHCRNGSCRYVRALFPKYLYLIIALKYSSTETYLVTGLSMIAEVGGMAGLLLGVSFFHITKLIAFFIDMKIEKLQGRRSGSQTET